jgi:hypothetical protein
MTPEPVSGPAGDRDRLFCYLTHGYPLLPISEKR